MGPDISQMDSTMLYPMAKILNDPAEFGRVVLEGKKRDHCIMNADLDCADD
jgi:hypothetical protein